MTVLWVPFFILAAAAVIDQRTRLISDVFPWLLVAFAALANARGWTAIGWAASGLGLLAGAGAGFLLCRLLRFGAGDALLLAGVGAVLGARAFAVVLVLTFLCGGVLAVLARVRGQREMAYGSAIAGGYLLFLIFLEGIRART